MLQSIAQTNKFRYDFKN